MSDDTLVIKGPEYGCACGKRATTFFRRGQWCEDCYPGWEAVKNRPHSAWYIAEQMATPEEP